MAMATSVARRWSVCERSASPITRLKRLMEVSTRASDDLSDPLDSHLCSGRGVGRRRSTFPSDALACLRCHWTRPSPTMRGIRCFGLGRECGRATGVPRCGLTTESTVNAKQILPGIHAHPGISFNAACRASSRLLMSTFRAGTRTPVNFRRHGRPKPKPLLAASCATVIRLLPCSGIGCSSLICNQTDRFVLDGG
jgi:hypothetical protein